MQKLYYNRQQQHMNKAEALRQAQLDLLCVSNNVAHASASERNCSINLLATNSQRNESEVQYHPDPNEPFALPLFWAPFILM